GLVLGGSWLACMGGVWTARGRSAPRSSRRATAAAAADPEKPLAERYRDLWRRGQQWRDVTPRKDDTPRGRLRRKLEAYPPDAIGGGEGQGATLRQHQRLTDGVHQRRARDPLTAGLA